MHTGIQRHPGPRRARRRNILRSGYARAAAGTLVAALALAGCGSSSGGSDTGGGGGSTGSEGSVTVSVGVIPIVDVAPLYLGIKQGFFSAEHIKVQPKLQSGGSVITSSVLSGSLQFGFSNTTSLIIAASKGLPVKMISAGVAADKDVQKGYDAVVVKADSPIKTAKDLNGKTISVNGLNNVGPLTINTALTKAGADYKSVKYTEVQFPSANAALQQGRVDAAFVAEPFLSQGLAQGERVILYPFEQTAPSYTVSTYFTTSKYAEAHPDVVDRFVRAMNKSLAYAQSHPKAVRGIVPTYTKVPAEAAAKIRLPQWTPDMNKPTIKQTSKLALEYGYISKQPDLSTLIRPEPK